jgi:hypothetical protein
VFKGQQRGWGLGLRGLAKGRADREGSMDGVAMVGHEAHLSLFCCPPCFGLSSVDVCEELKSYLLSVLVEIQRRLHMGRSVSQSSYFTNGISPTPSLIGAERENQ